MLEDVRVDEIHLPAGEASSSRIRGHSLTLLGRNDVKCNDLSDDTLKFKFREPSVPKHLLLTFYLHHLQDGTVLFYEPRNKIYLYDFETETPTHTPKTKFLNFWALISCCSTHKKSR